MTILLDIDGVLVTTPVWRPTEQHADGFLKFNEKSAKNLARIVDETQASIVLTTTHRINYSLDKWKEILHTRGINPNSISKLNDISVLRDMSDRATEIKEWVAKNPNNDKYVIIDDDLSINGLPVAIRNKCVDKINDWFRRRGDTASVEHSARQITYAFPSFGSGSPGR